MSGVTKTSTQAAAANADEDDGILEDGRVDLGRRQDVVLESRSPNE
jgi:hypothetical protein